MEKKPDLFITITCNPKWLEIQNALLLEFQKRGLPHAHVLILAQSYNPKIVANYDTIISAEIPNKNSNPDTFNTVKQTMMHGPSGILNLNAPCMKNGKCSKRYSRNFQENTIENEDGYPIYRRRNNNQIIEVNKIKLDNCHDHATVEIENDEINLYLDACYILASEASLRIFHYYNEQLEDIIEHSTIEKSTLTIWFDANTKYPNAKQTTYADFPIQWVYNNQTKIWKPRQRGMGLMFKEAEQIQTGIQLLCQNTGNMTLELTDDIRNRALYYLQSILSKYGRNLSEFPNMPIPTISPNNEQNTN
ncbi:6067_t:CDS:2, partial [Rhizophagus irregularis]